MLLLQVKKAASTFFLAKEKSIKSKSTFGPNALFQVLLDPEWSVCGVSKRGEGPRGLEKPVCQKKLEPKEWRQKGNSTRGSQAVTHPSTSRAQRCLTSVIGRELVCSA